MSRSTRRPVTPRTAGIAASAVFTLLVSGGCATFAPEPERPAYGGTDQVGEVSADSLVGTWRVTALNPFPDQPDQETVIEYRADGSVSGEVEPDERSMAMMGENARMEITGLWSVEGGVMSHSDMDMEIVNGNALARMASGIMNGVMGDIASQADVYELSANRIVMVGDDGAAMRYDRL